MCGIGDSIVTISCSKVEGPTDPPPTTDAPCIDRWSICRKLTYNCQKYGEECRKSCGLCKGMKRHPSNDCPDTWKQCQTVFKEYCGNKAIKGYCDYSCGNCEGMTPHPSNKCWDDYIDCPLDKESSCRHFKDKCKRTCGLCENNDYDNSVIIELLRNKRS